MEWNALKKRFLQDKCASYQSGFKISWRTSLSITAHRIRPNSAAGVEGQRLLSVPKKYSLFISRFEQVHLSVVRTNTQKFGFIEHGQRIQEGVSTDLVRMLNGQDLSMITIFLNAGFIYVNEEDTVTLWDIRRYRIWNHTVAT